MSKKKINLPRRAGKTLLVGVYMTPAADDPEMVGLHVEGLSDGDPESPARALALGLLAEVDVERAVELVREAANRGMLKKFYH